MDVLTPIQQSPLARMFQKNLLSTFATVFVGVLVTASPISLWVWSVLIGGMILFAFIAYPRSIVSFIVNRSWESNEEGKQGLPFHVSLYAILLVSFLVSLLVQYAQDVLLRREGFQLSEEIVHFVAETAQNDPFSTRFPGTHEEWAKNTEEGLKYHQQRDAEFLRRFGVKIGGFCEALEKRGMLKKEKEPGRTICSESHPPTNFVGVYFSPEIFARVASQLPKPENWFSGRWALSLIASIFCSFFVLVLIQQVIKHLMESVGGGRL